MPKLTYYLDAEQNEKLKISAGFAWKNTRIIYNGNEIGSFANQKEIKKGKEFEIDSTRNLSVKLKGNFQPELELLVNGEVIKGSPFDPAIQLKNVANAGIAIGSINIILGLITKLYNIKAFIEAGLGLGTIIMGLIIIGLALLVKRKSMVALAIIMALIVLDIIFGLYFASLQEKDINPTTGIMIKIFFLIYLYKGFSAIKKLKNPSVEKAI